MHARAAGFRAGACEPQRHLPDSDADIRCGSDRGDCGFGDRREPGGERVYEEAVRDLGPSQQERQ